MPRNEADADTMTRVRSVVIEVGGLASVAIDASLRDAGLTSLDMVKVVLAIEDAFAIELTDREVSPRNFASIRSIGDLLANRSDVAAPGAFN